MTGPASSPLIDQYLVQRDALKRLFAARLGSADRAEDMVQELYFKVAALDPAEPILKPEAYLYRLAMNLMLDHVRQRQRAAARDAAWRDLSHTSVGGEDVADTPAAEDALAARLRLANLVGIVASLAPQARQAFQLHKFDGLTQSETAARMGLSTKAVEHLISGALKAILTRLEP